MNHRHLASLAAPWLAAAALACQPPDSATESVPEAAADFVGVQVCSRCHALQTDQWRPSQHAHAMQPANQATVLADFSNTHFTHFGVESTFSRRDGKFIVRTDASDGRLHDFEIVYTLGVFPLQQYLIKMGGGRIQALAIAWDTRPSDQGGQRWFHLNPDEAIAADDELHWTGIQMNWNHMCAECHTTHPQKNFNSEDRSFKTTWAEMNVGCEACHGPGSQHVTWAELASAASAPTDRGLTVQFPAPGSWLFDDGAAIAHREPALDSEAEIDTCARCHSRRSTLQDGPVSDRPLLDSHRPALLESGLYTADGQILDEVYVYGSFLQSRMYAAGVRCSDCHSPHTLGLADEPDAVCSRCHRSSVYATANHHHHRPRSAGASCTACHMRSRTYMAVDERHDHSFRLPRPDLSEKIGTPNACTDCHAERTAQWASSQLADWRGQAPPPGPHYGEALEAGRRGAPGAAKLLEALASNGAEPAIVRATALMLLGRVGHNNLEALLEISMRDRDPLVRLAAIEAADALPPRRRLALVGRFLGDPILGLRLGAERVLRAGAPAGTPGLAEARAAFHASQRQHADRPESWLNLGLFYAQTGDIDRARHAYQRALEISPHFLPAYVNLADLYRIAGRDQAGVAVLRRGLEIAPRSADLHHALGLALIRANLAEAAIGSLRRAAQLAPELSRYGFVYAIAIDSAGDRNAAIEVLEDLRQRFPGNREITRALASMQNQPRRPVN